MNRIAEYIDNRSDFGEIDTDTVLLAILARRGPDIQREIRLEFERDGSEFPHEDKDTAFAQGQQALERAVDFLVANGVPHFTLLPYRYLLIVLARVFAHHPEPDPTNRRLLGRWYWRAALLGPAIFKGATTGSARILCGKVRPGDLTGSVRDLLAAVDHPPPAPPDLRRFRTNEVPTKIVLCSWWDLGPRNPDTGLPYERPDLAEVLKDRSTAADAIHHLIARRQIPHECRLWAANRVFMPNLTEPIDVVGISYCPGDRNSTTRNGGTFAIPMPSPRKSRTCWHVRMHRAYCHDVRSNSPGCSSPSSSANASGASRTRRP